MNLKCRFINKLYISNGMSPMSICTHAQSHIVVNMNESKQLNFNVVDQNRC